MKAQIKLLVVASIATLGVSSFANASINASMEMVCDNVNALNVKENRTSTDKADNDSTLMSQHFAVTTCSGKQLLSTTSLENASLLSNKSNDDQLVGSTD
ncbi:hypothetical protein AB6T38_13265 [Aliiglaciecola sp. SL4]|uniref:hypothetical protein n=1 Tax=Aliiglaciecola sp. SL4 TaxID=3239806 RepID=UPI00355C0E32